MSIFPTKILLATGGSELHVVLVELPAAYVGMGPSEIADIPPPGQEELDEMLGDGWMPR